MTENEKKQESRQIVFRELVTAIVRMGYPMEFGVLIAKSLNTEKTMRRMIGYLRNAHPHSAEEIADEMLAITSDRDRWVQKKKAEYYNSRYNELLYTGLGAEGEDSDAEENARLTDHENSDLDVNSSVSEDEKNDLDRDSDAR